MNELSNNAPMMEMRDLFVGYGTKTVVGEISHRIMRGQFVSLLGPNGVGKTTILRTLARLLAPQKGSIILNGKNLQDFRQEELARNLAVVLTERIFFGMFTGFDFVALGRYPHTGFLGTMQVIDYEKTTEAIDMVNATDLTERNFNELSDGERQKLLLARALAQEPEIILLDEPTIHLDLKHRLEIMSILRRFCREKGITVISSMHDVDIASKVSDIVALVRNGSIIAWGEPEEILNEETVSHLYELDSAIYDKWLGSIEMKGEKGAGNVFVVAGCGTGATIYRLLSKRGFGILTGILHENDIDCYVAKAVGADLFLEKALQPINSSRIAEVMARLNGSELVLDMGFPVNEMNRSNLDILKICLQENKKIISKRSKEEAQKLFGEFHKELIYCRDEIGLLEVLQRITNGGD